ncbi:MAG TPA: ROK family protein [Cytophagales bacterium]|nr:ROK family protein [Cytophagales bacterium]
MNNSIVLGADIGGSHITAALVDLNNKSLLPATRTRKPVNSHGSAHEIIKQWAEVIRETFAFHPDGRGKIGIAMPGPFDYEEGISLIKDQDKYDSLYGKNIKNLLGAELSLAPENFYLVNDAGSFIQGEFFGGSIQGYENAIGITLGTGLGSAVLKNQVGNDANLWCMPFKNGIAEDYMSTRWFKQRYQELSGKEVKNVKELFERYNSDNLARVVFDEFGNNLSSFLYKFLESEVAEVIILGGNISNASELFLPVVIEELNRRGITLPIKIASLGEDAAIIGAAGGWFEKSLCC